MIFKTYTVEDGLAANPVRKIYQDHNGFIWIGTREGLSKYEGHKFTNYNTSNGLSHNMVNDLYESEDGKMYVAENNGSVDILQHDAIVHRSAFHNVVINQFSILKDNRVIAATDTSGLHEIKDEDLIKPVQPLPGTSYIHLVDLNDSLLIGGAEGTVRVMNKNFETVYEIQESKELLTFKFFKDSKGRLFICTNNGLKIVLTLQKNKSAVYVVSSAPFDVPVVTSSSINDILEDANQNFWIATSNGLVKIYADGSWQQFSEKDGLPSADITCLFQDTEKNIWIGTSLGLSKLVTKNDIRIYNVQNSLGSRGATFLQALNSHLLLLSTGVGLQLFNIQSKLFSPLNSKDSFFYYGLVQSRSSGFVFTYNNKLGRYDSVNQCIVDYNKKDIPNSKVYCATMDEHGIVFSGTQTGLLINSGNKSWFEKKFPYRITTLLLDGKGYLWVGTWDKGLYRLHYNSNSDSLNITLRDFSNMIPDKSIRSLMKDSKRNIWVGTRYFGIVRLVGGNEDKEPVKDLTYDIGHGLMSNHIRVIAEDVSGCIWIGSDLGVDKLIPTEKAFRVFNFSRVNNYFGVVNSIVPMTNHSVWFTGNGLVNVIDGGMETSPPPNTYLTSVDLGDSNFNYNAYHAGLKVALKYDQNQAKFEFSAPAFINEKQVFYSYHLLGSTDTAWSIPSNLHTISYASLKPGRYRFEVRTIGWNEQLGVPKTFEFSVQPAYWQTWWFYSMIACFGVVVLYAIYLYRIRQLLKFQKIRNRIATDLHDDIGSTLTNINMLSEISRTNLGKPVEAEKYLARITEEVTASIQALNDIIWNVNSRNDSMEETLYRMRRYAAELFDSSNIAFHLTMDERIAGKKINMEQRRDLYLVYKECMNNIVKHARANNVWVEMQLQNEKLHLKIEDDGKGFEPAIVTDRNGLRNIRMRTEKWKGSISIRTATGKGVSIEILLPLLA